MLYFAYGMNTNVQEMARRCPGAVSLGHATLVDHKFRFAGPADVQVNRLCQVEGVLWDITDNCLAALDMLEGYPFYYDRKWATVELDGEKCQALVYFMQPGHKNHPPSSGYFATVLEGYEAHNVPTQQLWKNVYFSTQILA